MSEGVHKIVSKQEMKVERKWKHQDGGLQQVDATITDPVSEQEDFRCLCGETFDTQSQAEDHIVETVQ